MSDPEAGDSESVGENPEPEDDASLSAHSENGDLQQSDQTEDTGCASVQQIVPNGNDRTESCNVSPEEPNDCASGSSIESDTSRVLKDLQEEPAESERVFRENCSQLAGSEHTESDSQDAANGMQIVESACSQPEEEQNTEIHETPEGNHATTQSSTTESLDLESPPEDELFASSVSQDGPLMAKNLKDTVCEDPPEDQSPPIAMFDLSEIVATATVNATDVEEKNRFAGHDDHMPNAQFRETCEGPDGDSDQAPECDREQKESSQSSVGCDMETILPSPNSVLSTNNFNSVLSPSSGLDDAAPSFSSTHLNCTFSEAVLSLSSADGVQPTDSEPEYRSALFAPFHTNANAPQPLSLSSASLSVTPENVNKQVYVNRDKSSDQAMPAQSNQLSLSSPPRGQVLGAVSVKQATDPMKRPLFFDDDSDEEELLTELDAELQLRSSPRREQANLQCLSSNVPLNGMKAMDSVANAELCKQFEAQLLQLQDTILQREREIRRLSEEKNRQREVSQEVIKDRDKIKGELAIFKDKNPDDIYLPQIKEMENTITQQQNEIRQLKEKLTVHDSAAKRAIATLQTEMKSRIDQITKLYEDSCKEKDSMVMKFAQAETKNIEVKYAAEKLEGRIRDLLKEKEFNNNKMRAALAEKQKAVSEMQAKANEAAAVQKEMEKVKEEKSSMDYKIKWFQNKLKTEQDALKETKGNLDKMTSKWKEAKEETEIIRKDCQAIVKKYQESEEVRSNSLDKELKLKEAELMIKMKEKMDTDESHQKMKRELEYFKSQYKDAVVELTTLKDKVQCLEEERLREEEVQSKYQVIMQNQKTENTNLAKQLSEYHTLKEDFDRAQEMIKALDHEMSELKLTNRDLQKDIEGCQARESKMLTLQSELSRTNAFLRSDNTNLSNQVTTLSGEVQKMHMDIQDLETRCRNLTDQLEEEQAKQKEETTVLAAQLAVKTKESEQYKQKWEDELDSIKTWKRKHASNVKDLTRQLQHAKKRLEAYDNGSGDRDATSMGSRTNSNGSLNSMDNSSQHSHPGGQYNHHHSSQHRAPSQEPEYPVITEQVEVDKQMLIERIVRLQRSLARKNEKLEFLEEHIQQLISEIKKKNKIIQGYVVREEAGTLASDVMDANKALLARKGGIMASVYSQHQQDGSMTLDLSLEINKKLQAVLEDTLLKNMTLKENLDTLGAEIARLSQENRRLQLHIQGLG